MIISKIHKLKVVTLLLLSLHLTAFNIVLLCNPAKCCHTFKQRSVKHCCCKDENDGSCNTELNTKNILKFSSCNCVHQTSDDNSFTFYKSYEIHKYEMMSLVNLQITQPVEKIKVELSENEFRINSPPIYLSFSSLLI